MFSNNFYKFQPIFHSRDEIGKLQVNALIHKKYKFFEYLTYKRGFSWYYDELYGFSEKETYLTCRMICTKNHRAIMDLIIRYGYPCTRDDLVYAWSVGVDVRSLS